MMDSKNDIQKEQEGGFGAIVEGLFTDHPEAAEDFKAGQRFRSEIDKETDRGMALFGVSRLEVLLKELLEKKLVGGKTHVDKLFDFNGPLGTFSSKINMAYSLGLIPKSTRVELNTLRELRNKFAHSDQAIDFNSEEIATICKKLTYIVRTSEPADRLRIGYLISLLYFNLRTEIRKASPFTEKKDHYDGESKKKLDKVIDEVHNDLKKLLERDFPGNTVEKL
jgi:DNA-binding MltR family transcriptional regulator